MNFIGRIKKAMYLKPVRIIPATRKTNAARPRHRIFIMYPGSSKIHSTFKYLNLENVETHSLYRTSFVRNQIKSAKWNIIKGIEENAQGNNLIFYSQN